MKTLYKSRWVSILSFTLSTPSLGVSFDWSGAAYRYIWTLSIGLWSREVSIRWWNRKATRWVNR